MKTNTLMGLGSKLVPNPVEMEWGHHIPRTVCSVACCGGMREKPLVAKFCTEPKCKHCAPPRKKKSVGMFKAPFVEECAISQWGSGVESCSISWTWLSLRLWHKPPLQPSEQAGPLLRAFPHISLSHLKNGMALWSREPHGSPITEKSCFSLTNAIPTLYLIIKLCLPVTSQHACNFYLSEGLSTFLFSASIIFAGWLLPPHLRKLLAISETSWRGFFPPAPGGWKETALCCIKQEEFSLIIFFFFPKQEDYGDC